MIKISANFVSNKCSSDDQPRTPVHATSPLPPIKDKIIPDVPIIFLMGKRIYFFLDLAIKQFSSCADLPCNYLIRMSGTNSSVLIPVMFTTYQLNIW